MSAPSITAQPCADAPMSVKQLADALGHHPSYVYAMRGAGFVMEWDATEGCEVATLSKARAWLKETGFRKP